MKLPWWSDENRLFVLWPLGITVNLRYLAVRLGLVRRTGEGGEVPTPDAPPREVAATEASREERLRRQIERSRYEERR